MADVYQLGQYIKRGRTDEAANLAKKLSNQRVQLEVKLGENQQEEIPISYVKTKIKVKIDSNDRNIANQHKEQTVNVYPSTTIAELRAAVSIKKIKKTILSRKFFYSSLNIRRNFHQQINTFLSMVIWHMKHQL